MSTAELDNLKQVISTLSGVIDNVATNVFTLVQSGADKTEHLEKCLEINQTVRKVASKLHELQLNLQWNAGSSPEYFDHFIDQYHGWRNTKNPLWLERAVFGLLAIKQGAHALELCCGDGFNSYHFYSLRCAQVLAVDFDETAISHAEKCNSADNIAYRLCDIRNNFPQGTFDNVMWDGAIEHFSPPEIATVMNNIKQRLTPAGILSGYTIKQLSENSKSLSHHEYEFQSKEDLARFLTPHFKNVKVFETVYPSRHNLYFYCSDGVLPFDGDSPQVFQVKK